MNRRDFLRRSSLIAAGVVAADQIELLERLAPRRLFPSACTWGADDIALWDPALREVWKHSMFHAHYAVSGQNLMQVLNFDTGMVHTIEPRTGRNAATGELHRL